MLGSQPTDGGHLILTEDEHALIVAEYPEAKAFFKRFVGSYELINGLFRWCLFPNSTVACPLWVTTTLSSILTWTLPLRSSSLW